MSAPASEEAAPAVSRLVIAGVGGQGVLSAARWLGDAAVLAGQNVRIGQLHGMSQRGGSVQATVLFGPGESSFIRRGSAEMLLALEPLELARSADKLAPGARALVSSGQVVPFTLAQQGAAYPDASEIFASVRARGIELLVIDGPDLAARAAAPRSLNVVMLGALSGLGALPFDEAHLHEAMERRCPPRLIEGNRRAFQLGAEAARA